MRMFICKSDTQQNCDTFGHTSVFERSTFDSISEDKTPKYRATSAGSLLATYKVSERYMKYF